MYANHHQYTSAIHCGLSSSLLSLPNPKCQHGIRGLSLSLLQHCRFDNFGSFALQWTTRIYIFFVFLSLSTPSPHRCLHQRLRLIAVFINVFASSLSSSTSSPHRCLHQRLRLIAVFINVFASSLSSSTSSPPSPSRRCLGRLRLCFIAVLAVFVDAITSSPASPSPFTDRPQWPSPQGALGNAPVGTSLCRCGGGFLRVCIPCNGFRHLVSPDLSSDKSHLVRDPYDAMRS
ncbi:hypothetical protein OUZ56_013422 [Daphnia magna]|uniref:Uncharacterized protein n=1 Tax=Daphnia magna TaxID=35525 RepID=A0ABQ9Z5W6_9CRUS|nr:hypothetical protein OUZ56_013422 [Daphnia magna]